MTQHKQISGYWCNGIINVGFFKFYFYVQWNLKVNDIATFTFFYAIEKKKEVKKKVWSAKAEADVFLSLLNLCPHTKESI